MRTLFRAAPIRLATAALVAAASLLASGCGFSSSRLVSEPGVSTIAVLQFDNKTFRRDLEFRLTAMVAEEVRARTPWRIETPARADVLLSGTIEAADVRDLERDKDGNAIIDRFSMVVMAKLVDRSSGRVIREWSVRDREEFTPNRFHESLDTTATDRLNRRLAEEIVNGMARPIGDPASAPPRKLAKPKRHGE